MSKSGGACHSEEGYARRRNLSPVVPQAPVKAPGVKRSYCLLIRMMTGYNLCYHATVKLFNRKDHVPILSPNNITILNRILFEMSGIKIAVVLWMRVLKDERGKVNGLGSAIAEKDTEAQFSGILCTRDCKRRIFATHSQNPSNRKTYNVSLRGKSSLNCRPPALLWKKET